MATLETQPLTTSKIVNFTGAAVVQNEGQSITAEVTPGLVGTLGGKPANGVTDEENSKMQICWNQAMCKEMQIPEGYEKVAVLILKWNKELDQLNSESEVSQPLTLHHISRRSLHLAHVDHYSLNEPFSLETGQGPRKPIPQGFQLPH